MIVAFVYLLLCALVAHAATGRGRWTLGYFLLSIFLSPLIGILILFVAGQRFTGAYSLKPTIADELPAEAAQQRQLWKLGFRDRAALQTMGCLQADDLIGQLRNRPANTAPIVAAVILFPLGALTVWGLMKGKAKEREIFARARAEAAPPTPPTVPVASDPASAQREAIARFPQLGVAGSALNKDFLARVAHYRREKPLLFNDPAWPLIVAEESDRALRAATAQR